MGKVVEKAKQAIGAATATIATAKGVYELAVTVEGRPVRERLKPAKIKILGFTLFERDSQLERTWFGVIPRGRSKVAKAEVARQQGEGP